MSHRSEALAARLEAGAALAAFASTLPATEWQARGEIASPALSWMTVAVVYFRVNRRRMLS